MARQITPATNAAAAKASKMSEMIRMCLRLCFASALRAKLVGFCFAGEGITVGFAALVCKVYVCACDFALRHDTVEMRGQRRIEARVLECFKHVLVLPFVYALNIGAARTLVKLSITRFFKNRLLGSFRRRIGYGLSRIGAGFLRNC